MSFLRRLLGRDDREAMDVWSQDVPLATPSTPPMPPEPGAEPGDDGSVYLVDPGRNKINVIKVVREATGLGLREAKDLVESAPVAIDSGWDAAELRRRLAEAGAQVN